MYVWIFCARYPILLASGQKQKRGTHSKKHIKFKCEFKKKKNETNLFEY